MISSLTNPNHPQNGGAPVHPDACMVCVAEAAGWTSASSRMTTLCNFHFWEYCREKFGA